MNISQIKKPIFIISLHRSGSTLLKNILNSNSNLAIVPDELNMSDPIFTSLENTINRHRDKNNKKMVNIIFNNHLNTSGWVKYPKTSKLKNNLMIMSKGLILSAPKFTSLLMDEYKKLENKNNIGIKYPIHHSRINRLLTWYPDAKIIFLTRDIRAIIASKLNDEATKRRKLKAGVFKFIIHYVTMLFFLFDFISFSKTFKKNIKKPNIYKISYENIGSNPEKEIKKLCDFVDIKFEEEMLKACGKPSSHNGKIKYGFDEKRIYKWKTVLNKFDKFIVNNLCKNAMNRIGY